MSELPIIRYEEHDLNGTIRITDALHASKSSSSQAAVDDPHRLLPSIEGYALRLQEFRAFQVRADRFCGGQAVLVHVAPYDRNPTVVPMLSAQPLENPFRRVLLLGRLGLIFF